MKKNLLFALFLVLISTVTIAATKTYGGASGGDWNTASNWSPSGVPTASDDVVIPSGRTVNISANSFANTVSISGTLTINDNVQLAVSNNFTVNSGGTFTMPGGSGLAILVVYGNYYNNGSTDFWKSTVVIAGDLMSPASSSIQNNGNVVVGGNIVGTFNTTGGTGSNQIYATNPSATVTISPSTVDTNVNPGTSVVHPPETQVLVDLVNLVLYGNTCSFSNSTANVTTCTGSTATLTTTTTATSPSFQWQVNKNDGTGWNNITNSAPYSGATAANLIITGVTSAMNNYKYRAQVSAGSCAKYGSYGVLTVNSAVSAPIVGAITTATCSLSNGSVALSGLPSTGTWTLMRSGTSSGTATGTGTTTTISGLSLGTYTFTVSDGSCTSVASASAVLSALTNTWNGNAWSTGSAPTSSQNIVISGNYTASASLVGCSLTVSSGTLVIPSPYSITLGNAVTVSGGSLTIGSGASLIQTDDTSVNTGNIVIQRQVTMRRTDYVYWSSPVAGFSSAAICPTTNYIYKWNPSVANSNGGQGQWQAGVETMTLGKGYIVRGPSTYSTSVALPYTAAFSGVPNNGIIQPSITRGTIVAALTGTNGATINSYDDNWNLVGNPYPSAIDATAFLAANTNIAGNVRLWTHGTAISLGGSTFYGSFVYNYNTNDYVNYNSTGSTPPGFNGKIGSGQSFFVSMNESTAVTENVTFNNSMRGSAYSNTQFYRTGSTADESATSRLWLSLVDSNNVAATTLVGYIDGATTGRDRMYDAPNVTQSGSSSIYSIIDAEPMIIQGRPAPFDAADTVAMGVTIAVDGSYTIAIGELDGLFTSNAQDIYLQDMATGIVTNLRTAPYSFTATAGTYNNRFVLRYNNTLLGVASVKANQTFAFVSNHHLQIESNEGISQVEVYDIAGQLVNIYKLNDPKKQITTDFNFSNGVYFAKVKLEDGSIIARKFFN